MNVVSHWSANLPALAVYLVAAVAHLLGMSDGATRPRRAARPGWAGRSRLTDPALVQAVAYHAGLLVALFALVSPVGYWSYRFVWVRNVQDVALAVAAPALIVLGAPWLPLRRGLGLGRRALPSGPDQAGGPGAAAGQRTPHPAPAGLTAARGGWHAVPILVTAGFCVLWWAWHMPALFDGALHNTFVYAAEVVTYLAAGIMLWLQLVGSRPVVPRSGPLHQVALVLATVTSGTILGLIRVYGSALVYPAYVGPGHPATIGPGHNILSVVADQQVGGAVLWVIPLVPFSALAVALAIKWLSDDEKSPATAADYDRLLKPRKSAWPSRPGLR